MQITYVLLKIEHAKPIADLTDHAANRISTMSHVEGVTAVMFRDDAAGKAVIDALMPWESK